ncbi:MAG TPA: hypothetical protein VL282_05725 [Tepidisphaeraceae bacterium]|jgi:hypothetical protein|nr:hypothetical protein [Tepidisphaeraceae bacterium]
MAEHEQLNFEGELRKYAEAVPFVPFDIVTASGDRYRVQERLQLAMGGSAVVLVLPRTGIQLIRKNQITAVHVHEKLNGGRKKSK